MVLDLSERSRAVLRRLVETYMETGTPVASKFLSERLDERLSPSSIRSVMAELERTGLLYAPHTSAGRLPTEAGLRLFVDGLLETGNVTQNDREALEAHAKAQGLSLEDILSHTVATLSGLARGAGLVLAPTQDAAIRHVEFVRLNPEKALVVIVNETGAVENRVIDLPHGLPQSALLQAGNYLSARLQGRSLAEARAAILTELAAQRAELDERATRLVEAGLAVWTQDATNPLLIIRGQANLLADVKAAEDVERVRQLFVELDTRQDLLNLLERTEGAQGVRIFIGAENRLFGLSGCSLVAAPIEGPGQKIVGAIGVIGPTRLNYARVVPMVDFTAQALSKLLGNPNNG